MEIQSLASWYDSAKIFHWKGHEIVYKAHQSDKPWLLLIHGFPTASFDWWKIWNQLSTDYSLITLDMIGFGYSDKPRKFPYSIMAQADLIEGLMTELQVASCHILAHDYGDTVAQELLARHNEENCFEIQSTCLLNGGIFPEAHHPLLIQKMLMSPIGFLLSRMLNQKKFEKSFGSIFGDNTQLTKEELEEYWELVSYKEGHRIAHLIIRYMKERVVNRERWVTALKKFDRPLGLIDGLVDPISGHVMVNHFKEIIQQHNIWTMDEIGHYPQVEAPEILLRHYREFMSIS